MAVKIYTESSLINSEVYQGIEEELKIKNKAVELINNSKRIKNSDVEAAYITIKQMTDSLTREALKAFDNERIVMLYNTVPSLSMTQAMPFMTFKTKKGYVTFIFADKYITTTRDGVTKIEPSVFRDLLIGALIANGIKNDYSNLATNQYLSKILMEIYEKLFTRILNREFAIASDKITYDKVRFYINKFFLINIFSTSDEMSNIDKLATAHVKYLDEVQIIDCKNKYNDANVTKLSELLGLIKEESSRMKGLSLSMLLNDWVNYYYAPSMMAVDNIEYLIFMTICLLSGNGAIVNIAASDIVKEAKNIKSYRGELLKLI